MQYEPSLSPRCVVAQHFDFFETGADGFGGSWSLTRESLRDGELRDQEHAKSDHCESLHGSALPVLVGITKRLFNIYSTTPRIKSCVYIESEKSPTVPNA